VIRPRRLLLLLIPLLPAGVLAEPLALQEGESLGYRVAWGIFFHAGEIAIDARGGALEGRPCTIVSSLTSTRGFLRGFLAFDAHAESFFDRATGNMLAHAESSDGGRKKTNTLLTLDYATAAARFTDFVDAARSQPVALPPGEAPLDLITSLIQTRSWDLQPGDARDINVVFERDIYQLTIHALRYETITTPLGTFRTIVYEPRMEKTPPKGMFKRGSQVHVWIARDDARRLPVKFEVEFSFGTGVATLVRHQPVAAVALNPVASP